MKKIFIAFFLSMAMLGLLTACGPQSGEAEAAKVKIYNAGTYEGKSSGHGGLIKVSVTVSEYEIIDVAVTQHNETEGIGSLAVEALPKAILEAQSPEVDTYTGATESSEGIIAATKEALAKAAVGN